MDGNGRIGRLLITLYLIDQKLLSKPSLYLSDYFERNRQRYYDSLSAVRGKNDIKQWIQFFLVGVLETSKRSINSFEQIIKLRSRCDEMVFRMGRRAKNGKKILNILFSKPIVSAVWLKENTGLAYRTVNDIIADFVQFGILREVTGYKRNRNFVFYDYLKIFQS